METFKVFDATVLITIMVITIIVDIVLLFWRIPIDGLGGALTMLTATAIFTVPVFFVCRLFTFFHVPNIVTMPLYLIVHLFIASAFMNTTPTRSLGASEAIDNANKEVRQWQEEYKRVNGHYF